MEDSIFADSPYQKFIFYRTYSRWNDELGRRETWEETVDRYVNYMRGKVGGAFSEDEYREIRDSILKQEVMPSMRLLWSAGRACDKTNVTAYNCSYIAPTKLQDFGEILYLLTCGAGVGFSVEKRFVEQLPVVKARTQDWSLHVIEDSREGWADALVTGLETWYAGGEVSFDYSKIRPEGARLQTMGGRASGYKPLERLLDFAKAKIRSREGQQLRPIDVHDIICKIGDVVVSGGVRRSSEISLSDLHDKEMRDAKSGEFWVDNIQRSMANNSAVFNEIPTYEEFSAEWDALKNSGTGERGIFNRANLPRHMPERRQFIGSMGTNPCGEITLRSKQFCNLTEVVCREEDTLESLLRKIRVATMLGTYQSSLTNFPYLSSDWAKNCQEECLLGVSLTGQMDCPEVRKEDVLTKLKEYAIAINEQYADKLKISRSKSITCVKPSGTVSQLVNASSGLHPRFAKHYIRRVRIAATDPLFHMLKDQGINYKPETGQSDHITTYVVEFPVKAPYKSIVSQEMGAIMQLEYWKMVKLAFTEHNPSCTIYVKDNEWDIVKEWVWSNWDIVGGLSFLPRDSHVYPLAPYEEITEERYNELEKNMPKIDFSQLTKYEKDDNTEGAKELACSSGVCSVDDIKR